MRYKIEDIISKPGFTVKILQYDTSENELPGLDILTPAEKVIYHSFRSIKRKHEFYFTRVLWQQFNTASPIQYNERGRPLCSPGHISISHSRDVIAIALDEDHHTGIDVEYISPKITSVAKKFLSARDEQLFNATDVTLLTVCWSIKEAIYKMEDIPGLSFKEHIHVFFDGRLNIGKADVIKDSETHHYDFNFLLRDKYVLTYCSRRDLTGKSVH